MWCGQCNNEVVDCTCSPSAAERISKHSGVAGHVASKWCRRCDSHYAACKCEDPAWAVRAGGKFYPLSAFGQADGS